MSMHNLLPFINSYYTHIFSFMIFFFCCRWFVHIDIVNNILRRLFNSLPISRIHIFTIFVSRVFSPSFHSCLNSNIFYPWLSSTNEITLTRCSVFLQFHFSFSLSCFASVCIAVLFVNKIKKNSQIQFFICLMSMPNIIITHKPLHFMHSILFFSTVCVNNDKNQKPKNV